MLLNNVASTMSQDHITKDVPLIFDAVFECTLDMINKVVILLLYQYHNIIIIII